MLQIGCRKRENLALESLDTTKVFDSIEWPSFKYSKALVLEMFFNKNESLASTNPLGE